MQITGSKEGTYNVYIASGDIKSKTISINIVDIATREELAKAEEERLAKEQSEKEAEEKATKDAEEKAVKAAEEQAAKEAEERAAKEAEEKAVKEQTSNTSENPVSEVQSTTQESNLQNNTNSSGGGESNFNTYDNTSQQQTEATYVLNTSTMKIHYPSCSSVKKIAPQNYSTSSSSVDELISQGYSTCGICFK